MIMFSYDFNMPHEEIREENQLIVQISADQYEVDSESSCCFSDIEHEL